MKQLLPIIDLFAGLDLGQANDYCALAVLERTVSPPSEERRYAVRALKRWALGTSYPDVARNVRDMLGRLPAGARLVVDSTGVGQPVVDMLKEMDLPCRLVPVTITGGISVGGNVREGFRVPKQHLVAVVQVLLQNRRLVFADGLPLAKVCRAELENFRLKITPAGNEQYEAWRQSDKDDIVLAVSISAWLGENELEPYRGPLVYNERIPFDPDDVPPEEQLKPRYRQVLDDLDIDLEEDWH
jgi:hypothetical protein